jgi:large subunit ribosomal protein L14e
MGFNNFVEIGRVALIIYGPLDGKLCTIIDVVDANKVTFFLLRCLT